jgi:hypothetical protein
MGLANVNSLGVIGNFQIGDQKLVLLLNWRTGVGFVVLFEEIKKKY